MEFKIMLFVLAVVGIAVSFIAISTEGFSLWNLTGILFSIPLLLEKGDVKNEY